EPVVIRMGADPEPDYRVSFHCPKGAVAKAHPGRVDGRRARLHLLETESRVRRILLKNPVRIARLLSDLGWQRGEQLPELASNVRVHNRSGSSGSVCPSRYSASAAAASAASCSPDVAMAWSKSSSAASSASIRAASKSCSGTGSFEAASKAC